MDETKFGWYRWIGANSPHFFWGLWGAGVGGFGVVVLHGSGALTLLNTYGVAVTALFTVVLAISTIGLYVATHRLWFAAERQIELARDGARTAATAARAAETSARAAQDAVDHAKETAQRQLRAYVTITKHRALHYKLEAGHDIVPCVTLKNRGQTPAQEVTVSIIATYSSPDQIAAFQITSDPSTAFTLAPGERSTVTTPIDPLTDELIAGLEAGTTVMILLCEVNYTDVFGEPRRTRMRAFSEHSEHVDAKGHLALHWSGADNDMT